MIARVPEIGAISSSVEFVCLVLHCRIAHPANTSNAMRSYFLLLLFSTLWLAARPQADVVIGPDDQLDYYSFGEHAAVWEDPERSLTPNDVPEAVMHPGTEVPNLDFTTSAWWASFSVANASGREGQYWLEVARPLTNRVALYQSALSEDPRWEKVAEIGDEYPFDDRYVRHRKMLFPIMLANGAEMQYLLRMESDGEVITLPLRLWKHEAFLHNDNMEQSILGTYYGMLIIVFVIYLFFWLGLRDRTFLYYILYIAALGLFQYSIDGLAFQYIWPEWVWLGNHAIVLSACVAVIALLGYAQAFLGLKAQLPRFNRAYQALMALLGIGVVLSLSSGSVYAISFPFANIISLVATLMVLASVIYGRYKKLKISPFFALAFVFLVLGGVVFILGNTNVIPNTIFTEQAIKFGSGLEVIFLSISMAQKFRDIQEEKERATAAMLEAVQENERILSEQNVVLERKVDERTAEINHQKEVLAEINKDLTDSINYAQRIQTAILPAQQDVAALLPDSFVLFLPKDIVSGDFYWVARHGKQVLFCAADCTGHGVPGALMSMIGTSLLNEVVNEKGIVSPGRVLDEVRDGVIRSLKQSGEAGTQKDGMDAALCSLDTETGQLSFSGANNPLYLLRAGDAPLVDPEGNNVEPDAMLSTETVHLYEVKGHKQPVGVYSMGMSPFADHTHALQLEKGDRVYLFSDGYADQFGGPKGKKFKYKPFKQLLLNSFTSTMQEQHALLAETFANWKGEVEQVDDICVFGVAW